jgi:hypothetical protein
MVAVLDENKKPLMPCSEKRARKLLEKGEAKPYWFKGDFCIILQRKPKSDYKQDICIGIDPGSKMSALTIKSEAQTIKNVQYSAPNFVKKKVEIRSASRGGRRKRNTPYRKCRFNRKGNKRIPPSTKSRWLQHLNLIKHFSKIYPINLVAFEDVKAKKIKGAKRWNKNFSPLEVGKNWFYDEVEKSYALYLYRGFETYTFRNSLGLHKGKDKMKVAFESHCVDSWVLANQVVGGHIEPDNKKLTFLKPLNFYRRQLHEHCPAKKGIRRNYGGTLSLGIKRGTLVKHNKWGFCLVGGTSKGRISLHCLQTNKRLTQLAKKEDLKIITNLKWNSSIPTFIEEKSNFEQKL